jgi:hypothetical protein
MVDVEARVGKMMEAGVVAAAGTTMRAAQVVPLEMVQVLAMAVIKPPMCLRMAFSALGKVDSSRMKGGIIRDTIIVLISVAMWDTMVTMSAALLLIVSTMVGWAMARAGMLLKRRD